MERSSWLRDFILRKNPPLQNRAMRGLQIAIGTAMNRDELDLLDSSVASIEGVYDEAVYASTRSSRFDSRPYRPSRDAEETLRLMDKYISRAVKMEGGWAAIGPSGRACFGPTLSIAVCKAIVEGR
jgi:hypothetical protein